MKKTVAMVALFLAITLLTTSCAKQTEAEETNSTEVIPFTHEQIIADNAVWYASGDNSCLRFEEDGTFFCYEDEGMENSHYYTGTYEVATGQEARDALTEIFSNHYFSEKAIDSFMEYRWGDAPENFVCITMHCNSFVVNGEENYLKDEEGVRILYAYFMNGDKTMMIADITNHRLFSFEKHA
jgi:hypothetical protein